MYIPITEECIQEIINENSPKNLGVLIRLLSFYYIKGHRITEEEFFQSLKRSLNKLNKED